MMNRTAALSIIAGLALASPVAMAETARPVAAQVVTTPVPSSTDAATYATRQAADHKPAEWKGGYERQDYVVVVSGSTLLLALIILLILV
jgi:hypothetical protein